MEIFRQLVSALGNTPAWAPLILIPALAVAAAVMFTLLGGRRAYAFLAAALGAAGFALMCCIGELYEAFVWAGLFAALASLLRLLFLIPRPRRRGRRTAREERIYERFRGEPLVPSVHGASDPAPPRCAVLKRRRPRRSRPNSRTRSLSWTSSAGKNCPPPTGWKRTSCPAASPRSGGARLPKRSGERSTTASLPC